MVQSAQNEHRTRILKPFRDHFQFSCVPGVYCFGFCYQINTSSTFRCQPVARELHTLLNFVFECLDVNIRIASKTESLGDLLRGAVFVTPQHLVTYPRPILQI